MKHLAIGVATAAAILTAMPAAGATEITLGRFFGACENAGSDTKSSVGEACIIQSIINAFSAADNGVTVETLPTDWGNYYDQIKAAYAGRTAPHVHVLHRSALAEFAALGALADIGDDLEAVGIDPDDWVERARDAVTVDGRIYAVPMDLHANLWHVNLDLMEQAGLVDDAGHPVLPSSPDELVEHARILKEATGKNYLAADFAEFPIGVRLVLALLWQQGSTIFGDGEATVNTPEALNAVRTITALFDENLADPRLNYADSEQAFLNGEAAILVNGTWVVDAYSAQAAREDTALDRYYVADFPTLFGEAATWADSHIWGIPARLKAEDPEKYQAALQFLAFLNDHNVDWARTGHMAIRQSVLDSDEYANLPHRSEYTQTAQIARDNPPAVRYGAIQDTLNRELQAIWLTGKDPADALETAEQDIQDLLDR